MNHFQERLRHELDDEFLTKFYSSFGEQKLSELISHLDRYPDDGEQPLGYLLDFRIIRWESGCCRRDVVYIYRERVRTIIYVDCVEPPDQNYRWFRNLDPVQMLEIGVKLSELIEKIFTVLFAVSLRSKKVSCVGGSDDYQREEGMRG